MIRGRKSSTHLLSSLDMSQVLNQMPFDAWTLGCVVSPFSHAL